jgi:uncharacterized protein (DUF2236 family)
MPLFVKQESIVRKIWGNADTILFVFAGASAEFALNKAVDWLYFTGKLPADPLGRLFSTVGYAQKIVFAEYVDAMAAIDTITHIHKAVEAKRGTHIPAWAYRDVLFMLIDYSIRAFQLLERPLTSLEKEELFTTFIAIGSRMGIEGLPTTFDEWVIMRADHLLQNLERSKLTTHLYQQYKTHLGFVRYQILKQAQVLVVPQRVRKLLPLNRIPLLLPVVQVYKLARKIKLGGMLKNAILPNAYKKKVADMDFGRLANK